MKKNLRGFKTYDEAQAYVEELIKLLEELK